MAYLVHSNPQIGFPSAPVNHSPSPLGFGFGLSSTTSTAGWQSSYTPQTQSTLHHSPSALQPQQRTVQKRRHDDEDDLRDEAMDRSPTPERRPIKRIVPKRMRISPGVQHESGTGNDKDKENKTSDAGADGVDVGMLLAGLSPQSLLPLLTSLLVSQPSLKPLILSLIPRPTLDTAISALAQSAKKLRDAYPYSNVPASSTSFGFGGSTFTSSRANMPASASGSSLSGFGRLSHPSGGGTQGSGMRDSYVLSRLRPHIFEFVSAAFSYLSYFSYLPSSPTSPLSQWGKDKPLAHPTESFAYLSALTGHVISQPPLTQSSLAPLLLPRLLQEWMAWIDRVDAYLNKEGGMFGIEVGRGWERALDEFAEAKISGTSGETEGGLKAVRDKWVARVGWLVGRREIQRMDDDEEL